MRSLPLPNRWRPTVGPGAAHDEPRSTPQAGGSSTARGRPPSPIREAGYLIGTGRANLGRRHPRRACIRSRVEPDPLPPDGLGERPVQHAVNACHGSWGQRPVVSAPNPEEVPVEVVDVLGGELRHVKVPQVGLEVAVDHRAGMADRREYPSWRCRLEPAVEEVGQGSGPEAREPDLLDQLLELGSSEALATVDRPGCPLLAAGVGVGPLVDAELPGILATPAHRSASHFGATVRLRSWASHGQLMGNLGESGG